VSDKDKKMRSLYGFLPKDIALLLPQEKPFRGRQIFTWVQKGIDSFDSMVNIPKYMRQYLQEAGCSLFCSHVIDQQIDHDGTAKLGIQLQDGAVIECVLLTDEHGRKTACLSSQVGCAMGCAFCRTGLMGLTRNLSAAEIVEQFHHLQDLFGTISHIVYMGMGEPFANLDAVRTSIQILNHELGVNVGLRKITISTCGIADGIYQLAENGPHVKLAVSLVAADNELRRTLMPITNAYPIETLYDAMKAYQQATGRRITLEYVLLGGINDTRKAAHQLISYTRGINVIINLIPWNPGAELDFTAPSGDAVKRFSEYLTEAGVHVTRRYRRGRGVNGACGQLAVKYQQTL